MNTVLDVHLGPIAVGTIELSSSGERIFRFSGAYLDLPTFESVAALLHAVDPGCSREFIRRLVFMILSGTEDAHLKNWALLYDDEGVRARLSPAYDLLCTIAYQGNSSPRLALRIAGQHDARQLTGQSFAAIAEKLGERFDTVLAWIVEDVERMRACYASDSAHWPLPLVAREALDRHLDSLPLASGRAR
ncbi:HipA domain-containing protein [Sorangium sp. So ce1014]|uniref:HipA domain-containing protein n=1 Tax=Sorangium sp. So ce1014 TaxID=3133326 RepID=UPI003F63C004